MLQCGNIVIFYQEQSKRHVSTLVRVTKFMRMQYNTKADCLPPVILALFLPFPLCSLSSCHVCDFQTELNAQFVSHMSLHVDKEQWMFSLCCSVCDYACMEESDMKNHISTGHAGRESLMILCFRMAPSLIRCMLELKHSFVFFSFFFS